MGDDHEFVFFPVIRTQAERDHHLITLGRLLFPGVVKDAAAMEEALKNSGLEWTVVRPPELTNKPYSGKFRVREGHLPRFGFSIARANVADFMIKAGGDRSLIRKVVGVSN